MKVFELINGKLMNIFKIVLALTTFVSIFAVPAGAQTAANNVICAMINIYNTVYDVIFLMGLLLMLLGGALYAAAHIMPGQSKGTIQGYGMGMILGGVIGVVLALLLPYIFGVISGNSAQTYISPSAASQYGCPSS
ncbi:MAG: hypothetical protein ACP5LH_02570 [Candidatus Micrarchaeia archaeon]